MFIVTFVVMLPTFLATRIRSPHGRRVWPGRSSIGVIILIGAFVGPAIRKYTPRAALLGTLAGISLTFISMRPAAQMWETLWVALPVFGIIVLGFISGSSCP